MKAKPWINAIEIITAIEAGAQPILIGITPSWQFRLRHIPGSYQIWRPQLWEKGTSRLVNREQFSTWAQHLGIHADSRIVIWDDRYDATWLWWAFQHYGKHDARILEGGLQAWCTAGLPLAHGRGRQRHGQQRGSFVAKTDSRFPIATFEQVVESRTDPKYQLWDTRDLEEWQGRKRLRGAGRSGRIPWATHLPWQMFRETGNTTKSFRSDADFKALIHQYGLNQDKHQIFYCQSGVRTTTAIYALYRIGWDPQRLHNYCGSWREWSNRPGTECA